MWTSQFLNDDKPTLFKAIVWCRHQRRVTSLDHNELKEYDSIQGLESNVNTDFVKNWKICHHFG